jgi:hypothetical protein
MMDHTLDSEAHRLFVSAALSTHAARCLRGHVPPHSAGEYLLEMARLLGEEANTIGRRYRLRFEPPYPGVTAAPEPVRGGFRPLLACTAVYDGGTPLGVTFTALIPGRPPRVSVAPVGARIPEEWRPLADLL